MYCLACETHKKEPRAFYNAKDRSAHWRQQPEHEEGHAGREDDPKFAGYLRGEQEQDKPTE